MSETKLTFTRDVFFPYKGFDYSFNLSHICKNELENTNRLKNGNKREFISSCILQL